MRSLVYEHNPDALFCDGFDDAIIGVAMRFGIDAVAAYDYDKIIAALMKDGCSEEQALEHFDFNIVGGWHGPNTPVFVSILTNEQPTTNLEAN